MKKRSTAQILLALLLVGGVVYFLVKTETGKRWVERLKNSAAEHLDRWLADLEIYLSKMETAAEAEAAAEPSEPVAT